MPPPQTETLDTPPQGRGALVVAKACGALVALVGLAVLAGWAFDVPALKSLHPAFVTMKANTAAAFMLGGGAVWLEANARSRAAAHWLARACGATVALIGLLTLAEIVFGWNLGIDELLFREPQGAAHTSSPGRMAPATAFAFALVGGGVLGISGAQSKRASYANHAAFIAAGAIGFAGILGYVYGATAFPLPTHTAMAIHTAAAFVALAVGALCAHPGRWPVAALIGGGAEGQLGRRLLAVAFVVPVAVGWLRLQGERAGLFGQAAGVTLMVVSTVILLAAATLWNTGVVAAWAHRAREEQRAWADLVTNMPIGFIAWRIARLDDPCPQFTLVAANSAADHAIGLPLTTRIGETMSEIAPEAAVASRLQMYADVLRLGQAKDLGLIKGSSATTRDRTFRLRVFPLPGQSIGMAFEDVTDREHAAIVHSRLAAIVDSSDDAIIGKSLDGLITSWNAGAERMFLYTSDEAIGRPTSLFIPASRRDEELLLIERLKKGEHVGHFETVRMRKDQAELDVSASLSPVRDSAGAITGISTIVRDVTEQKKMQQAIVRAKEAAEATSKELEAFSYSVSHDLRAPLRGIDGFSQALVEDYADKLGEEGNRRLTRIRAAAQKMGQLIDDMIKLSRVTRAALERTEVDLSAIAREVVDELRRADPDRSVRVIIQDGLVAEGDARLLRVALDNLIGNAWKFTGKVADACIEVGRSEPVDGRPAYFVRDNGAGFDMAYANKLFDAFQRLHAAGEFPGTGIGLATVQRVVRRHGGHVWAEGAVGQGARFFFTL